MPVSVYILHLNCN